MSKPKFACKSLLKKSPLQLCFFSTPRESPWFDDWPTTDGWPCLVTHHTTRVISLWIFVPANKTDCTLATHGADQGSSATVIKAASNFSFERKENVQFAGQPHSSCKVPTEDVLKFIIREKKKR